MHVHNYLTSLLPLYVAATVSAAPLSDRTTSHTAGSWQVSGLSVGCSPGGCEYNFVIVGPQTSQTPGFNTTCQGSDVANAYQACADSTVSANLIPHTDPVWEVDVRHQWTVNGVAGSNAREQYGQKNFTDGTTQFTIPITSEGSSS